MVEPRRHPVRANGLALVVWEWPGTSPRRPSVAGTPEAEPAALLLHGIGNYGRFWDLVADEIGGRLPLLAPDARGHGDSEKPRAGYRAEDYIADALGVLDAFGIERCVLVGHSMGGAHALGLAWRFPERVRALVVVDVGPEILPEGRERAFRLTTQRPERFATDAEAVAYLKATSPGYTDAVYEHRVQWVFRASPEGGLEWRSSRDALLQTLGERGRAERLWEVVRAIAAPTTLIRGTNSYVLGAETARRMVEALPQGSLLELEAGHNVPLDRPREVAEAILAAASVSSG